METINSIEKINELKDKNDMLLLYFESGSCGVCEAMLPKIEGMLQKYPNIVPYRVETENSLELSAKCGIFTVPAIILLINGKETLREAGIINLVNLEQKISRYYALYYGNN